VSTERSRKLEDEAKTRKEDELGRNRTLQDGVKPGLGTWPDGAGRDGLGGVERLDSSRVRP
jgi:hypothetical protein